MSKGFWVATAVVLLMFGLGSWWLFAAQPVSFAWIGSAPLHTDASLSESTSAGGYYPTTTSSNSAVMIAENLPGASIFASWLTSTGVASKLTGKGPYTIFVPTDGSISQLPSGTYSNLSYADKVRFVEYHIVQGRAIDATAESTGAIQAMSGDALNFSNGVNNIPMVDSAIIIAEYKAANGVVYLVSNAMQPPQKQ